MRVDSEAPRQIAVVMLSWQSADIIQRVVRSAREWADFVFVLDTGSTDASRNVLEGLASNDSGVRVFFVDTNVDTFNHGRCVNILLDRLDDSGISPYWFVKLDCDEMFEPGFAEHCLPVIKNLPRFYTQVSFSRPTLFYSESLLIKNGPNATFREQAFQRWRRGLRYPETRHHLHRTLTRPAVTFFSSALLLHYSLRSTERARLQYERLEKIDREWPHLLIDPDSEEIELEELVLLSERGGDQAPSTLKAFMAYGRGHIPRPVKSTTWRALRAVLGRDRASELVVEHS